MQSLVRLVNLLTVSLFVGFATFKIIDWLHPLPRAQQLKKFSQVVVDKHGRPLRAFADNNGVWRYPTEMERVAPEYLQALIHYEDRQFWSHRGVNPLAILRAVKQWIVNGKPISGGSTLTMQVARILDPHKKSIGGKLYQIFRAYQLEYHFDKKTILNLYLNYAPFGGPVEGVEAAAYTYLGKSAQHLTSAEAALLAVLPQSPSRLRPDRYPDRARNARDKVLNRLQTFQAWSPQKVRSAKQELVVAEFNSKPMIAPLLSRYLKNKYPQQQVIEANLDKDLQIAVADLVKDYLYRFSGNTSASAMVIDNQSLGVLAYVGAADFANQDRFGHIDMNRAIRSPGSTLKPFIYGMAMDAGLIHSESLLQDVPLNFSGYSPENFNKSFAGPVSVSEALQQSLNVPSVQVLNHLGPENFYTRLTNAGLSLYLPQKHQPSLSIALGGTGVKLFQLLGAYRAIAIEGRSGVPRYITSEPKQESFLMSPQAAYIVGEILSDVPLEPRQKSRYLKKARRWLAHKTGTSYGYRDAWMVAVNQQYSIAVWVGKPDGTPSPGEFGRKTAAPLVRRIVELLPNDQSRKRQQPTKVSRQTICWPLGKSLALTEERHCHQQKVAWLIEQASPATLYEEQGLKSNPLTINLSKKDNQRVLASCFNGEVRQENVALWPPKLEHWLVPEWQRSTLVPRFHKDCSKSVNYQTDLVIVGVEESAKIAKPPDSKDDFELSFTVLASQDDVTWLLNGKKVAQSAAHKPVLLKQLVRGRYQLMVFNRQGQVGNLNFEVL